MRLGITQPKVAEAGGVSKTTVIGYESGAHLPDALFLSRVRELGMDVGYVVTGERAVVKAGTDFDWDLLEVLLEVVESFEDRRQRALSPKGKARIIRILYNASSATGRVDSGLARAVLDEAA